MTCDHDSMKASLPAFVGATHFVGIQLFDDEVQYMGNCPGCRTTLTVVIDLARGHAVRGEIDMAEMTRHANEIIR